MWKKIFIILFIILCGLIIYMAWGFVSSNLAESDDITILSSTDFDAATDNQSTTDPLKNINLDNAEEENTDKSSAYHVTPDDCADTCKSFEDGTEGWRYCANICGIIPSEKPVGDCSDETGLSRDYCLRNVAIETTDHGMCDEITDRGIADHCRNRIAENIIDASF